MLPDRVSNPGPLTYESGALPIALRGPATDNLKGHNSAKNVDELRFFFYLQHLVTLNICTKFQKNILDGIKLKCGHDFHLKNFKGTLFHKKCRWSYSSFSLHII